MPSPILHASIPARELFWFLAALLLLLAPLARAQSSASQGTPQPATQQILGAYQQQTAAQAVTGSWIADIGGKAMRLTLRGDKTFALDSLAGTWDIAAGQIALHFAGQTTAYDFDITADTLTLHNGDLHGDLAFRRTTDIVGTVSGWFSVSPAGLRLKLIRILVVLGVMTAARLLIFLLQGISNFVVHSRFSPIGFVWGDRKRHVRTLHSLILNVAKYIIYFAALGFILSEFGINYTAYIASLSVVGLAIGFGSQGLVQDMVTGFFVIFEGQFDVGDMVDISGTTGIVTELGLRMTKLRNYNGQTIIIPNRNISVVGNYLLGSQVATIDVDIAKPEDGVQACKVLDTIASEIFDQFGGTITRDPTTEGPLKHETGELYVRLHLNLWPGQTWIVDQQLLPGIRAAFKKAGLEIAADRMVAFYYAREQVRHVSFRDRLQEGFHLGKRAQGEAAASDDTDL